MTGSTKPAYGFCSVCNEWRHLRANGMVGAHRFVTPGGRRTDTRCPGVGRPPGPDGPPFVFPLGAAQ